MLHIIRQYASLFRFRFFRKLEWSEFRDVILFLYFLRDSLVAQIAKNLPAMQETWIRSWGQEDPLDKEMATHFTIFAWEIPWTEEPGRLSPWGCKQSDTIERLKLPLHSHIISRESETRYYFGTTLALTDARDRATGRGIGRVSSESVVSWKTPAVRRPMWGRTLAVYELLLGVSHVSGLSFCLLLWGTWVVVGLRWVLTTVQKHCGGQLDKHLVNSERP